MSLNNRNHRKIAVIDGEFAFMGGINIVVMNTSMSTARMGIGRIQL